MFSTRSRIITAEEWRVDWIRPGLTRIRNRQLSAYFSSEVLAKLAVPGNCLDFVCHWIAPDGMTSTFAFEHTSMPL
jgi:hypothetical protein